MASVGKMFAAARSQLSTVGALSSAYAAIDSYRTGHITESQLRGLLADLGGHDISTVYPISVTLFGITIFERNAS